MTVRVHRSPSTRALDSYQPGVRLVAGITLAIWFLLCGLVPALEASPQTSATDKQASIWDPARKPISGWGRSATAENQGEAPQAPVAKPAIQKASADLRPKARPVQVMTMASATRMSGSTPPARAAGSTPKPAAEPSPVTAERVKAVAPVTTDTPVASKPDGPAASGAAPAQTAVRVPTAAPKPAPTGLEKLSDEWPKWIKLSMQYRGRVDAARGIVSSADYDTYYLNRVRLGVQLDLKPWLQVTAVAQDSQVMEYATQPSPRSLANTFDLRFGYVTLGGAKGQPGYIRVGRQELSFGEGRLFATPDWGNTNRTYDAIRGTVTVASIKIDAFAGSAVDVKQGGFDPRRPNENFYGVYAAADRGVPGVLEPFLIVRTNHVATSELGPKGDAVLYTYGARSYGDFKPGVGWAADLMLQQGDVVGDPVTAWAVHAALIRTMNKTPWKPKVTIEYNFASGDDDPLDGKRQTFDQVYGGNHNRYGLADIIGLRNMHHGGMMIDVSPLKPLKLSVGLHQFYLASRTDGLYGAGGARSVYVKNATSRNIGWEADILANYTLSKELSIGAGLGTVFTGSYLEQAGASDRYYTPYLVWNMKF